LFCTLIALAFVALAFMSERRSPGRFVDADRAEEGGG
jgi:hypothetical protein